MSEAEEALTRAETLLAKVDDLRERLEATEDAEAALGLLEELVEVARELQGEIERAKREADARP